MKNIQLYIIGLLGIIILVMYLWFSERGNELQLSINRHKSVLQTLEIEKIKLTTHKRVSEQALKAISDTLSAERAKDKKIIVVKWRYRNELKKEAQNDIDKSESVTKLILSDDSLYTFVTAAYAKCDSGYHVLETEAVKYKSTTDSLLANCENRNLEKDTIITGYEKKDKKSTKKLIVAGVIAAVIGFFAGN